MFILTTSMCIIFPTALETSHFVWKAFKQQPRFMEENTDILFESCSFFNCIHLCQEKVASVHSSVTVWVVSLKLSLKLICCVFSFFFFFVGP